MKPVIYRIDFPTGDFYIGSTCNFSARRAAHLQAMRKPEKCVNKKLAKLMASHPVIAIYEIATGLSRETLHLLEHDVIGTLSPSLNVNLTPTPLPTRDDLAGSSKQYGPYKSLAEFAACNNMSYRQAKYAAKTYTWEEWSGPKLKQAKPSRHPPDPRKMSAVIASPTGWEWLADVKAVGQTSYELRRKKGMERWEAWTTKPMRRERAPVIRKERVVKRKILTCQGVTLTLDQWSSRLGVSKSAISSRLTSGWSLEQALGFDTSPPEIRAKVAAQKLSARKRHVKYTSPDGYTGSATDHARRLGISRYLAEKLAKSW